MQGSPCRAPVAGRVRAEGKHIRVEFTEAPVWIHSDNAVGAAGSATGHAARAVLQDLDAQSLTDPPGVPFPHLVKNLVLRNVFNVI